MESFQKIIWYLLLIFLICFAPISNCFADDATLEVVSEGKVNIRSVMNLAPLNTPPASPSNGDLYYTAVGELMVYGNNKWNKLMYYTQDWEISNWGACSAECAGGTQTRTIICRRADGQQVPDSYCGVKPDVSQACNTHTCTVCMFNYSVSPYSVWLVLPNSAAYLHWEGFIAQLGANETSFVTGGYLYTRGTYNTTNQFGFLVYEICRTPQ